MKKSRQKAITGIEMLIVTVITALIAATAVMSFTFLSRTRLAAETQKLVSELRRVRQLAEATHQNYIVSFDVDGDNSVDADDRNAYVIDDESGARISRQRLDVDLAASTNGISFRTRNNAVLAIRGFRFLYTDTLAGDPVSERGRMIRSIPFTLPNSPPYVIVLTYRGQQRAVHIFDETGYITEGEVPPF
jgi:type II secretory pathway pseudopilin PulG